MGTRLARWFIQVADIGSLLSTRYQDRMTAALAGVPVPRAIADTITSSIGGALAVAAQAGGAVGRLLDQAARAAFISGGDLGLLTAAVVALAGCALVTVPSMRRPKDAGPGKDPD